MLFDHNPTRKSGHEYSAPTRWLTEVMADTEKDCDGQIGLAHRHYVSQACEWNTAKLNSSLAAFNAEVARAHGED